MYKRQALGFVVGVTLGLIVGVGLGFFVGVGVGVGIHTFGPRPHAVS